MNAIALDLKPGLPAEPFNEATARVNEWRGRTLQAFGRAETAVTEHLLALAAVAGRGGQVELPHLVGQRFDALSQAIGPGGPFEQEGATAIPALAKVQNQLRLRNMLCHGVAQVTLDRNGRWTVVLRLVGLRSGRKFRDSEILTQTEAEEARDRICRASQELQSRLAQARTRLA